MRLLDEQYMKTPFYGRRKMTAWLRNQGYDVNPKRVGRLMGVMGLAAIYPKPKMSQSSPEHRIYPYLLGNVTLTAPNQVWSTDITYVRLASGFMYLVAILDWFSRYVLSWRLSNTLDNAFCLAALDDALQQGKPAIFNSDQGRQFTARTFTTILAEAEIRISMDGRGRALDNIFVERLWRTVKYENIYLMDYDSVAALEAGLMRYFHFYNYVRLHQSLDYRTPAQVHFGTPASPLLEPTINRDLELGG
jgi:putative transposase